jgi:hypothetical protein
MKILIAAAVIALSISAPAAYADEASQRVIVEELLQTMKVDQMMKPLFGQMKSLMEQQFTQAGNAAEYGNHAETYAGIAGKDKEYLRATERRN